MIMPSKGDRRSKSKSMCESKGKRKSKSGKILFIVVTL